MSHIDHIVYAVPDLQQGMDHIENLFGVRPVYGGKHEHQGTHNALLNLGNNIYLELLAVDPDNQEVLSPRWMGVDMIQESRLTRWAIKSDDIKSKVTVLKSKIPLLARSKTGMRKREDGSVLKWELTMPLPGPAVEIIPFFVDWQDSEHPTVKLPQHCKLIGLKAKHPQPEEIAPILESLGASVVLEQSDELQLVIEVETPKGRIILS